MSSEVEYFTIDGRGIWRYRSGYQTGVMKQAAAPTMQWRISVMRRDEWPGDRRIAYDDLPDWAKR